MNNGKEITSSAKPFRFIARHESKRLQRWCRSRCVGNCRDRCVDGEFITLRAPDPLGFYTKGLEGRIDDADAGWKGRGIWVPSGDRTPWLKEGGQGTKPLLVHFQLRPDPLAN